LIYIKVCACRLSLNSPNKVEYNGIQFPISPGAMMNRPTPSRIPSFPLADLPRFKDFDSAAIDAIERQASLYNLNTGDYLFRQGDTAHSIYIVLDGGVRLVEHTLDGQVVHLKLYARGDIFGMLALSGEFPLPAGIQAVTDSHILGIRGSHLRELVQTIPALGLLVIDLLIEHVHTSHSRIRQIAAERVEQRLARALLHYAQKFGTRVDDVVSIDIRLSQRDLAEFIGTTPETINRVLKAWEHKGIIHCGRQHIDILAECPLNQFAQSSTYMGRAF
jgi:CRP-like cAMP-binding protein